MESGTILRNLIFILFITGSFFCHGQNKGSVYSHTESRNAAFEVVFVDLKNYTELVIKTIDDQFYIADEKQSGEYKDALVLNSQVRNDSLLINDSLHPAFEFPQDKLSAHKITDSKVTLVIPKNKVVFLNLVHSDLTLSGDYREVVINIHTGSVLLKTLKGDINATSVNAGITGLKLENYRVTASSRNGSVSGDSNDYSKKYTMNLESINGDIHLN